MTYCRASIDQQPANGCAYDAYDEEEWDDGFRGENWLPCFQTLLAKRRVRGLSALLLIFRLVDAFGWRGVVHLVYVNSDL